MQTQQAASSVVEWLPTIVLGIAAILALMLVVRVLRGLGALLLALGEAGKALVTLAQGAARVIAGGLRCVGWLGRLWRTTAAILVLSVWLVVWGFVPGLVLLGVLLVVLGLAAIGWQIANPETFDVYCGRFLRSWWLRWGFYGLRWSTWVRNLGLSVRQTSTVPIAHEGSMSASAAAAMVTLDTPKIHRVRSGPAWDEVHVRLAIGQTVEDFEGKTLALATARRSARCVVRELEPRLVSLDFERHDSLAATLPPPALAQVPGESLDLRKVMIGATEYGTPWRLPVLGSHMLCAGVTGAGKNSVMWAALRALAPAIRAGLVRVRGIDPKVLEMDMARDLLYRYATEPADAAALLAEYVADLDERKQAVRGTTRTVQPTVEDPLELLLIDELGALTRYLGDKATRDRITQLLGLALSQGRGLALSVMAFVQDPTKETVPLRDLFPHRVCLRTQTEAQTEMVLGDGAVDRGALSHRIPDEGAEGVAYVLGESQRRPVRVRAGWTDDIGIEDLAAFCTPHGPVTGPVVAPVAELEPRRPKRTRDRDAA